jgi:hypothetical protein
MVRIGKPTAVVDDAKMFGDERFERHPRAQVAEVAVHKHHRVAATALSVCE